MAHETAQARKLDRLRKRHFGEGAELVLYTGTRLDALTVVSGGTFADGWFMRQVTDIKTGLESFKAWVYDADGTRKQKLRDATFFLIDRVYYRKQAPDPPVGVVTIWEFGITPAGILPSSSPSASVSPSASASPSASVSPSA
jgi:hypothetical protein